MRPAAPATAALLLGLACALPAAAPAGLSPTATAPTPTPIILAAAEAAAVSPAASADGDVVVLKEVRIVAKRRDAEREALLAAAKEALAQARLRHWKLNNVTEQDLIHSVLREERLTAFDLGLARLESVSQERMAGPDGQEAWKCRVLLTFRRK